MTEQQKEALINILRFAGAITPLQKDILDTWDILHQNPFNDDTAQKQIVSNNVNYPDIFVAIRLSPDVIQKPFRTVTKDDMVFNLGRQLDGLIAKEMEVQINGKKESRSKNQS